MEDQFSVSTIVISILCSIAGSWLFLKYQKISEYRVRNKIANLDFEIEYLERISKGYKDLIRVSIKVICVVIGVCICAAIVLIATESFQVLHPFRELAVIISIMLLLAACAMSFSHFYSIYQLSDLEGAKKKMTESKVKLERKLDN